MLSVPAEELTEALCATQSTVSLTVSDDDGEVQLDLPDEDETEKLCDKLSLHKAIDELPERDRKLIVLRYFSGLTQNETARMLGMTQVQVSRRERAILLEMRRRLLE